MSWVRALYNPGYLIKTAREQGKSYFGEEGYYALVAGAMTFIPYVGAPAAGAYLAVAKANEAERARRAQLAAFSQYAQNPVSFENALGMYPATVSGGVSVGISPNILPVAIIALVVGYLVLKK